MLVILLQSLGKLLYPNKGLNMSQNIGYNEVAYNETPYNQESVFIFDTLVETLTISDSFVVLFDQLLTEVVNSSDGLTSSLITKFVEIQTILDQVNATFTAVILSESIRVRNWLRISKNKNKTDFTN